MGMRKGCGRKRRWPRNTTTRGVGADPLLNTQGCLEATVAGV